MKTINYLFLLFFCFAISCTNEEIYYEGESFLHFPTASSDQMIQQGSVQKDVQIEYGTVSKVSGDAEVKLIVDPTSTAKEGVDFQIIKGTDNPNGKFNGTFTVRLLESGASSVAKRAVFKVQSSTIKNSIINFQTYTLTMSLKCAATLMNANFKNTTAFWNTPAGFNFDIVQSSATNELRIKDFLDTGRDLVLKYDPETYIVTVPTVYTGSNYSAAPYAGTQIWIRPSTDATQVSFFNPCTKTLTVNANYYLNGTNVGYGNQKEVFVGN
ncbi:hypothetical protein LPB85_01225 [Chryseobacterium sp. LC2016-27]|uniref:hypothetical protein n=1 Tax=Chryseobacterium sp. LC2016-27 TaxID=2897326 RepID=UPI001E488F35|nr:hypothetical protein [Chryseobacterium sp. LC2016-27]MCD0454062.1 hypothetical protein [Chryseobacterium sp. LC2016-27]